MEIIVAQQIQLKLIRLDYAQEIFDRISENKEYLSEWLPWVQVMKSVEDTINYIKVVEKQFKSGSGVQFSIFYEGEIVGLVGLNKIDRKTSTGYIGYWLGQKFQSQGIMTQSVKAVIDYSFNKLDLNKIEIRCAEGNLKSQQIPIRLGFNKGGIIENAEVVNGKTLDHVVYQMNN